jgi:hypothetical protein
MILPIGAGFTLPKANQFATTTVSEGFPNHHIEPVILTGI